MTCLGLSLASHLDHFASFPDRLLNGLCRRCISKAVLVAYLTAHEADPILFERNQVWQDTKQDSKATHLLGAGPGSLFIFESFV